MGEAVEAMVGGVDWMRDRVIRFSVREGEVEFGREGIENILDGVRSLLFLLVKRGAFSFWAFLFVT